MTDRVFTIEEIRKTRADKNRCLDQLGSIPFYITAGGAVLTKAEHVAAQLKKEEIERKGKDAL